MISFILAIWLLFIPVISSGAAQGYPEEPRILATTYNWEDGGISCDGDCSNSAILPVLKTEYLGRVAACPLDWVGHVTTTVVTLWDGSEWWCLDTMHEDYQGWHWHAPTYEWVRVVDFSYPNVYEFPYNQWLLDNYSLEWRPVAQFYLEAENDIYLPKKAVRPQ